MRTLVVATFAILTALPALAGDWPQFRGPDGQGHSDEKGIPVEWDAETNIAWKVEIPGNGWSSPVYQDGRIFLTLGGPTKSGDEQVCKYAVICLDAGDGSQIWLEELFEHPSGPSAKIHRKNSHASPTPVVDGGHLFVHFGTQGTACMTTDGEVVWKRTDLAYKPVHGGGNSPILAGDVLFVNCDGGDRQFVVGLDRSSGETVWKHDRPPLSGKKGFSFGTPLTIEVDGKTQIVSPAAEHLVAYDARDGAPIWQFDYEGYSLVPRPVYGHGLLYFSTGYDEATLVALKPARKPGDKPEVVWSTRKAAPLTPSPLLIGEEIYYLSDRGVATCADAKTGDVHWIQRLGGEYSASPVRIGDNIHALNEDGDTVVFRAGTEYVEVARNELPGRSLASMAVADGAIFLRTDTSLYRIAGE